MKEIKIDDFPESQQLRYLATLQMTDLFAPFHQKEMKDLLHYCSIRHYEPEETIIKDGEIGNNIFLLLFGIVQIKKQGKVIRRLSNAGDMFGEMGIVDGSPRSADVCTETKVECLVIDGTVLDAPDKYEDKEVLYLSYTFFRTMATMLAERLRDSTRKVISLTEKCSDLEKGLSNGNDSNEP